MNKVVFLDIDGVISIKESEWGIPKNIEVIDTYIANKDPSMFDGMGFFKSDLVSNLYDLLNQTGASIVLSSTWRVYVPFDLMKKLFKHLKIKAEIIGKTPILSGEAEDIRGEEINLYLKNNPLVTDYVIIDDKTFPLSEESQKRFVKTEPRVGLTGNDVSKAAAILNGMNESFIREILND